MFWTNYEQALEAASLILVLIVFYHFSPERPLYDKRNRKPEWGDPKNHENTQQLSHRRCVTKLIYLAIRNFEKTGRTVREWIAARNQFAIVSPERCNK